MSSFVRSRVHVEAEALIDTLGMSSKDLLRILRSPPGGKEISSFVSFIAFRLVSNRPATSDLVSALTSAYSAIAVSIVVVYFYFKYVIKSQRNTCMGEIRIQPC